jgi:hypothetical protein
MALAAGSCARLAPLAIRSMIGTGSRTYLLNETLNIVETAELRPGIEKGGRSSRNSVTQCNIETTLLRETQHHRRQKAIAGPDDTRGFDWQAIRAQSVMLAYQQSTLRS